MSTWIKNNTFKILYGIVALVIAIPFIQYIVEHKTIFNYIYVNSFTASKYGQEHTLLNTILYVSCFAVLFLLYFAIIKNRKKLFKNIKQILIFVGIMSIIFACIIPVTSLDVYSYIGTGWIDAHYQENPYYTSVNDIREQIEPEHYDKMLLKVAACWMDEPVVYGPVWAFLCKILTSFSGGSIDIALLIFKVAAILAVIACTWLIYQITNKKIFAILFGLNPLILFEAIANVHNDIFFIFFILLGIYFAIKSKKLWLAIIFLAIATGIKYMSVILIPFIVLYALRNEPLKTKLVKIFAYALEFIIVITACYAIYMQDFQVLSGILVQQDKYERSIFLLLYTMIGNEQVIDILKAITLGIFALMYIIIIGKLIWGKSQQKITFKKFMEKQQLFLWAFLFILITNFNAWYLLWLFPTIMWQKPENIRLILCFTIGGIMAYSITYFTQIDSRPMGIPFFFIMLVVTACTYGIWWGMRKKKIAIT